MAWGTGHGGTTLRLVGGHHGTAVGMAWGTVAPRWASLGGAVAQQRWARHGARWHHVGPRWGAPWHSGGQKVAQHRWAWHGARWHHLGASLAGTMAPGMHGGTASGVVGTPCHSAGKKHHHVVREVYNFPKATRQAADEPRFSVSGGFQGNPVSFSVQGGHGTQPCGLCGAQTLCGTQPLGRRALRRDGARSLRLQRRRVLEIHGGEGGRDESKRRRAESQWIVAARPLCHLQYPVAYLSRLQRILPAARWELNFKAARTVRPPHGLGQRHVPLGAEAPTAGRQTGGGRMHRF